MSSETPVETYETLYGQLQAVVMRLEAGELPLAETLRLYEQGVALSEACQRLLDQAELRVQQIQAADLMPDREG